MARVKKSAAFLLMCYLLIWKLHAVAEISVWYCVSLSHIHSYSAIYMSQTAGSAGLWYPGEVKALHFSWGAYHIVNSEFKTAPLEETWAKLVARCFLHNIN